MRGNTTAMPCPGSHPRSHLCSYNLLCSSVEDTNDGSVTDRNSQDLQRLDSIHGPMADWPTRELLRLEVSPCITLASPREMDMLMETGETRRVKYWRIWPSMEERNSQGEATGSCCP